MTLNPTAGESAAGAAGLRCVVCGGARISMITAAAGEQAFCETCFHGWRPDFPTFEYSGTTMCSHDMGRQRYEGQVRFFAPAAPKDATILELGCATGALAAVTRERLPVTRYDGIELSPSGEAARAHLDHLYTKPPTRLVEDGGFDRTYDLIILSHVLEHLEDPAAELRALERTLSADGAMFIEVPNRSGHPRLSIDDNISHLHCFSIASLSRLLANEGLQTVAAATGVYFDSRYPDSLQILARPFSPPRWSGTSISDHPALEGERDIVVWGAGGTAKELLANFFDLSRVAFFIDKDPAKQGLPCLGKDVRAPETLGRAPRTVLINSIDFADPIAADIARLYPDAPHRILRLGDLL